MDWTSGVDDPEYVPVAAGDGDDKSAHKSAQLTAWEREQFIRKIVLTGKAAGRYNAAGEN